MISVYRTDLEGARVTIWEAVAVCVAGVGAGAINTVVGSGTLLTFPVLLAVGVPPVTANVSNALGLVPGSVSGAIGYRRELRGQGRRVLLLSGVAFVGALTGAALLVALPSSAFDMIVPALIGVALLLVAVQPWLARVAERRRKKRGRTAHPNGGVMLSTGLLFSSAYGGYFGAAQGIIYLALMGLFLDERLQRINAVKNVLGALVNAAAAAFFLFVAEFDWTAVLLIAGGSAVGGQFGALVGRRLPPTALRAIVIAVGVVAIVHQLLS